MEIFWELFSRALLHRFLEFLLLYLLLLLRFVVYASLSLIYRQLFAKIITSLNPVFLAVITITLNAFNL